jgi:hypothetical protein
MMAQNEIEIAINNRVSSNVLGEVHTDTWEAGFDINRQVVVSKFLFYEKLFLRPDEYTPSFYHTVHPVLVQDWCLIEQIELYDGFCVMDFTLTIRFQATLKYLKINRRVLSEINQSIKSAYENQLLNITHRVLTTMPDGRWLKEGLAPIEQKISQLISEMFILHHIQAQVSCGLKPYFKEFPHIELTQENIYLGITQKDFEIEAKNQQELYRQEIEAEEKKQAQKKRLLEQLNQDLEIERLKVVLNAEHERLILVEKEGMQVDYFAIKERLLAEKNGHQNRLQEIELEAEFKEKHTQREAERKELLERLAYRQALDEKQLNADISRYEQQQKRWLKAKERVYIQRLAVIKKENALKR